MTATVERLVCFSGAGLDMLTELLDTAENCERAASACRSAGHAHEAACWLRLAAGLEGEAAAHWDRLVSVEEERAVHYRDYGDEAGVA